MRAVYALKLIFAFRQKGPANATAADTTLTSHIRTQPFARPATTRYCQWHRALAAPASGMLLINQKLALSAVRRDGADGMRRHTANEMHLAHACARTHLRNGPHSAIGRHERAERKCYATPIGRRACTTSMLHAAVQ